MIAVAIFYKKTAKPKQSDPEGNGVEMKISFDLAKREADETEFKAEAVCYETLAALQPLPAPQSDEEKRASYQFQAIAL